MNYISGEQQSKASQPYSDGRTQPKFNQSNFNDLTKEQKKQSIARKFKYLLSKRQSKTPASINKVSRKSKVIIKQQEEGQVQSIRNSKGRQFPEEQSTYFQTLTRNLSCLQQRDPLPNMNRYTPSLINECQQTLGSNTSKSEDMHNPQTQTNQKGVSEIPQIPKNNKMTIEQQRAFRNIKLKQYFFDLSDKFQHSKCAVMPSNRYLNFFADFLNKLVILSIDDHAFAEFFQQYAPCTPPHIIHSAREAFKIYKLNHFALYLFETLNEKKAEVFDFRQLKYGDGVQQIFMTADSIFSRQHIEISK